HDGDRQLQAPVGRGFTKRRPRRKFRMQMDLMHMAKNMGGIAWGVVIVLFIMSMYSIAVMIERYYTYSQATKQSRKYAPEVARCLYHGKLRWATEASHGPTVKHAH